MYKNLLFSIVSQFILFCFSIESATWTPPVNISTPFSNQSIIGMDSAGNVVAIWSQNDGVEDFLQAATFPFGGSWSAPQRISPVGVMVNSFDLAVAANGNAVVVWGGTDGINFIVQAAELPFGGSWQPETTISGVNSLNPSVGVDATGNATAIWQVNNSDIQTSSNTFGGAWAAPITLSVGGSVVGDPNIAVAPDGTAVAVWIRSDGSNFVAQSLTRVGGVWAAPGGTTLSATGADALELDIAIAPSGYAVAVWKRFDGATDRIQGAIQPVPNVWNAPTTISAAGFNSSQPDVEVDINNNATVVWISMDGVKDLLSSSLPFGSLVWSAIQQISLPGQFAVSPNLAVDNNGNAIVVWNDLSLFYSRVLASMHPLGGNWSSPDEITTFGEDSGSAVVALISNGSGYAVANWSNFVSSVIQSVHTTNEPSSNPLPPSNFLGKIKKNKFLNRTELVLTATWTASPSVDVVSYRIYKGGVVVANVSAGLPLIFRTDVKSKSSARQYEIVAVNAEGVESSRLPITIVK